jgi:hypothetical protein
MINTENTPAQDALLRIIFPTNWNKKNKRKPRPRPQFRFDTLFDLSE